MSLIPGIIPESGTHAKNLLPGMGLRLYDTHGKYVGISPPATIGTSVDWLLPTADGQNGYVLSTNGLGSLSWVAASGGGAFLAIANNLSDVASVSASRTNLGLGSAATHPATDFDAAGAAAAALTVAEAYTDSSLAAFVGTSNIVTLGTITTGVWHGTAIANANLANSSITLNTHPVSLGGSLSLTAADIGSPAALTKVNDTNVTLTLGGTPASALLAAASITAGWTGLLGLVRGGTNADLSLTGGAGQYLKQVTAGAAVTVGTIPASDIASGAALTRTNDTNVTLTLGGTPASSLLAAASITAGWSGTLSVARGGTGAGTAALGFAALSPLTTKGDLLSFSTINDRLPVGSDTFVLTADSTQTFGMKWAAGGGGASPANPSGLIGMTAVNGVAATYDRSDSTHAIDPAIVPTWTGIHKFDTGNVGVTSTDVVVFENPTAAALGAQQISGRSRWRGFGWGTTGSTSQSVDFIAEVLPAQGTVPTGNWNLSSSINGGAYTNVVSVTSAGLLTAANSIVATSNLFAKGGTLDLSSSGNGSVAIVGAANSMTFATGGSNPLFCASATNSGITVRSDYSLGFSSTSNTTIAQDTKLSRATGGGFISTITARASTTASPQFTFPTPADTATTASTEAIGMQFGGTAAGNLTSVVHQFATGTVTTQRENVFAQPTYSGVASMTITSAATVAIVGPPVAGTNVSITNKFALWIQSGVIRIDDGANGINQVGVDNVNKINGVALQNGNGTANVRFGLESNTGGGLFTGTAALAGVVGTTANAPIQIATNNTLRFTVDGSGNLQFTGEITKYNNISTAGLGVTATYAAANITAQSAAATITSYTAPASDGDYEVSASMNVTAATGISTSLTVTYTDVNNAAQTLLLPVQKAGGTGGTDLANGLIITTGDFVTPVTKLRVKASTTITIKTATGTFSGVTYSAAGNIKQVA